LQAVPAGFHGLSLPTAKTVILARVASKLSTSRVYQPLILHALKRYFDGPKRFLKQGDVFSVLMNADDVQYSRTSGVASSHEIADAGNHE